MVCLIVRRFADSCAKCSACRTNRLGGHSRLQSECRGDLDWGEGASSLRRQCREEDAETRKGLYTNAPRLSSRSSASRRRAKGYGVEMRVASRIRGREPARKEDRAGVKVGSDSIAHCGLR